MKKKTVNHADHLEDRDGEQQTDVAFADGQAADQDDAVEAVEATEEPAQTGVVRFRSDDDDYYEQQESQSQGLVVTQGQDQTAGGGGGGGHAGSGPRAHVAPAPKLLSTAYEINKFKVKENLLECDYVQIMNYEGISPVRKTMKATGGLPIHRDLLVAIRRLIPFFAHATEQDKNEPSILGAENEIPPHLQKFHVSGVSIGTDGGFILSGYRTLRGKQKLQLNTPHIPPNGERESWYNYADALEDIIRLAVSEVVLALDGKGFSPQMSLFEDDEAA